MNKDIQAALDRDLTIDIVTTGARTGLPRRIEIWYCRVDDRIIICGTPSASDDGHGDARTRGWLANLRANPEFLFCLKESITAELKARAMEVTDPDDRRHIMSAPSTKWYQDRVDSIDSLVEDSPIVEVFFSD